MQSKESITRKRTVSCTRESKHPQWQTIVEVVVKKEQVCHKLALRVLDGVGPDLPKFQYIGAASLLLLRKK